MPPSLPATTLFYLPGLIHQFGNMLLTLQGQALRLHSDPSWFERSFGSLVERGAAGLSILRILLGESGSGSGAASALIAQLVELGRVPAREHGIALELRQGPEPCLLAVAAEPFVRCCGEAIRVWVTSLPTGAEGVLAARLREADGAAVVQLAFEPDSGTLPFPAPSAEIEAQLAQQPCFDANAVELRSTDVGSELVFHPRATSTAWEA